jgi:hypothetical protein
MKPVALVLPVALALFFALVPATREQGASQEGWRLFEGSWSASGQRESLPTEAGRQAFTVYLSGAVVLSVGEGMSKGFRGEMIGFDDGVKMSVGRCVWTDERGDRIFSTLTGETIGTGRRILGTITGGTGRYSGLAGDYSFDWQYVVEGESGAIQGRAVALKGRYRAGGAPTAAAKVGTAGGAPPTGAAK